MVNSGDLTYQEAAKMRFVQMVDGVSFGTSAQAKIDEIARAEHNGFYYRCPKDLRRTSHESLRIVVVGSCLSHALAATFAALGPHDVEHIMFNNVADLTPKSDQELSNLHFQIVQVPLRSILREQRYFQLNYEDVQSYETLFHETCANLETFFDAAMSYNEQFDLLSFVGNYLIPQQNLYGKLLPRYDLRNPVYFIEKLNEFLSKLVSHRKNSYILNLDEISANFGRRYFQDDSLWIYTHSGVLGSFDHPRDQGRITPPSVIEDYYDLKASDFNLYAYEETMAMYATVSQLKSVKIVVIDLDDTLWRGILAEQEHFDHDAIEGWPLGFIQALLVLKARGIILAIASKNDENRVKQIWSQLLGGLLSLDDFAVVKINWQDKATNFAEILKETNLLPGNAVFIDDNPVERATIAENFPDTRVLGRDLYYIRRVLLWSPETQVSSITAESSRRTTMIRSQVSRNDEQRKLTREEFLSNLNVNISMFEARDSNSPHFARSLELINKTNQFNTTGERWSSAGLSALLREGGVVHVCDVRDKYTNYGIVWVAIVHQNQIRQIVMSCRVVGLGVELAALHLLCTKIFEIGFDRIQAVTNDTNLNLLSRNIFELGGFTRQEDGWLLDKQPIAMPKHITVI